MPSCINPLYQRARDSFIPVLRPDFMQILGGPSRGFDVQVLHGYVPAVLEVARSTLITLQMDLLFAVPLMCYGICLENVTSLEIGFDSKSTGSISTSILTLLKSFEFNRIFPKLSEVEIICNCGGISSDQISGFVEQGIATLRNTYPDRAINIKHLKLTSFTSPWDSTLPILGQMFPDVKTLSVAFEEPPRFPYALLWEYFVNLEELNVKNSQGSLSMIPNLDSVFCGIFPEEVAELREEDDEYLKAVNIVPVMPSITCMKGLRTFTLRCSAMATKYPYKHEHDPTFMFSKVTGLIGFARCPALAVTFLTTFYSFRKVMRHMKPYASIVVDCRLKRLTAAPVQK